MRRAPDGAPVGDLDGVDAPARPPTSDQSRRAIAAAEGAIAFLNATSGPPDPPPGAIAKLAPADAPNPPAGMPPAPRLEAGELWAVAGPGFRVIGRADAAATLVADRGAVLELPQTRDMRASRAQMRLGIASQPADRDTAMAHVGHQLAVAVLTEPYDIPRILETLPARLATAIRADDERKIPLRKVAATILVAPQLTLTATLRTGGAQRRVDFELTPDGRAELQAALAAQPQQRQ